MRPRFYVPPRHLGESSLRICSFAAGTRSNPRDALPPTLAPGNLSLGSARGESELNWRDIYHRHCIISNSQCGAERRRAGCFPAPCGGLDSVATRGSVVPGYTYTCHLVSRFSGLTLLENAVRPAHHSAHRPVGEPVRHHSTSNQMSGLQTMHRTSGAPAIRTEINSADSAAPLPDYILSGTMREGTMRKSRLLLEFLTHPSSHLSESSALSHVGRLT